MDQPIPDIILEDEQEIINIIENDEFDDLETVKEELGLEEHIP